MSSRGGDRGRGGTSRGGGPPRGAGRGGFDGGRGRGFDGGRGRGDGGRGGGGGGGRGGRGGAPASYSVEPLVLPDNPSLDQRLQDQNAQEGLVRALKTLRVEDDDDDIPTRPNYGTLGREVKLRSNYFPITQVPDTVEEYDIQIEPALKTKGMRKRLFEILQQEPSFRPFAKGTATDGVSKMIAYRKLPENATAFTVQYSDSDEGQDVRTPASSAKRYNIVLNHVKTIQVSTLTQYTEGNPEARGNEIGPVISAFNIILSKYAVSNGGVNVGKNRYFFKELSEQHSMRLDRLLEAHRGFYLSVRPLYKSISINLNVATTAFYIEQDLASALRIFKQSTLHGNPTAFVKGLKVKVTHLGYKKTVQRVGHSNPVTETFEHETHGKISVQTYFQKQYGITLQQLDLPLVDVGPRGRPVWIPPELCTILPNQPFRGKLTGAQTSQMINVACLPPQANQADIYRNGLTNMGLNASNEILQKFGVSLGSEMAVVPGRILDAPQIQYSAGPITVKDSAWNLRNAKFKRGASLKRAAAIALAVRNDDWTDANDPEFVEAVDTLEQTWLSYGMNPGRTASERAVQWKREIVRLPDRNMQSVVRVITQTLKGFPGRPDFTVFFLPSDDAVIYNSVKRVCDVDLGVPNLCILLPTLRRQKRPDQYWANVALKANVKLGGVNHILAGQGSTAWLKKEDTMLMGADVTHPGPGSLKGSPSIAAVVASIDDSFANYPASMALQETKKEMITNLGPMVLERLKAYQAKNSQKLPKRIVMFRDGVSEGQFLTVRHEELPQIREACRRAQPDGKYKPKVTIIIAGKRHHTRFYPADSMGRDETYHGNPRPGMVVDKGVTGVYTFDFFLQSHVGLKGHARPTHYTVVHDECGFDANTLQRLCHDMSHTFARATRGVSLIPPAYYADIACERGRCYLYGLLDADAASTVAGSVTSEEAEREVFERAKAMWANGIHAQIKNIMFYI